MKNPLVANPVYGVIDPEHNELCALQQEDRDAERKVVLREACAAMPGADRINWTHRKMSVKKLREATSETAFPQLLRAGVQNFLFDGYEQVAVIFPDLVRVVASDKYEELYAPMYGTELPKEVRGGQKFEDSRLMGLDKRLRNVKFGRMLAIERELVDDDQTGQIVQKSASMGERMRYVEEEAVMAAILTATYNATIGNVATTPARLSQVLLEEATIALHLMKDPLGQRIMVQPDTILVSPADEFNAAKLLQSALQPSVPGAAGQTANTATSGLTGWTMTMNPLQGLFALKVSRFLPAGVGGEVGLDAKSGVAFLMQTKKSLVFQDRDPLEVAQEATTSGTSFERDQYRWRTRRRFNTAVIEPRYLYRIN
jgi:phage major head subunit gpT-like protein